MVLQDGRQKMSDILIQKLTEPQNIGLIEMDQVKDWWKNYMKKEIKINSFNEKEPEFDIIPYEEI